MHTRFFKRLVWQVIAVLFAGFIWIAYESATSIADARGTRGGTARSVGGGHGGMSRGGGRSMSRPSHGGSRPSRASSSRPSTRDAQRSRSPTRDVSPSRSPSRDVSRPNRPANAGSRPAASGDRRPSADGSRPDRGDRTTNRETNRNTNRNTNINNDINVDVDDGWGGGDWDYPVGAGLAIGTAAAITSAAIGSMYYSLPPNCGYMYSYYNCGGVWYEPQYQGESVTYVVVEAPEGAGDDTTVVVEP